jgi:hypothetical protein
MGLGGMGVQFVCLSCSSRGMRVVESVAIGFVLEARIYEGGTAIFDLFLIWPVSGSALFP